MNPAMTRHLLLALPGLLNVACSSTPIALEVVEVNGNPPDIAYVDGIGWARLPDGSMVRVVDDGGDLYVHLNVVNPTEEAFDFRPKGVTATPFHDRSLSHARSEAVTAFSKREWLDTIESRMKTAYVFASIAAGLNSAGASMSGYTSGTYSGTGTSYGSGGTQTYTYYGTFSYQDQAARQIAMARADADNKAMFASIQKNFAAQIAFWTERYLGRTTLPPGEGLQGTIIISTTGGNAYLLELPIGDFDTELVVAAPPGLERSFTDKTGRAKWPGLR